ncbi:peptidoglycan DD-metalloendopeptidase family protein [Actinomadura sp. 7K507]|uniref:peptidoglycan DD-metalloendopeptidase family protein n=1 Tax=Actinomadura sp. 7K507 TaxID=2530365 RepID=UPI001045B2ED|nr:peptidoglycan DD-metalloendopeptidase family protein [Actinomadura sp. 7K507]TDC94902.1 hypothetical protein E1285_08135 [Actinomadura sp. 7K507]
MARRDIGHASRNDSHAPPWADTPARPSPGPEPRPGSSSGEAKPRPQWPEGSWWSEQPDGTERGRRSSRGPSRRDIKRHEARAKRSRRRAEDQFGARNEPSGNRDDRFESRVRQAAPRARPPAPRDEQPDARLRFGARNGPPDARTRQSGARDDESGARARQPGPRDGRPDARTGSGARDGRSEGRARQFGPRDGQPGAGARPSDPGAERFDARMRQLGARDAGSGGRARQGGSRDDRSEARTRGFGPGDDGSDARTAFGARDGRPDARTGFGARDGRPDARTGFGARDGRPDARTGFGVRDDRSEARTRQFEARARRSDPGAERFDARSEGFGPGRDRSREFQPRSGRPRRPERPRAQRVEDRPQRRRTRSRQPAGPPGPRRPAPPRPGPKAKPRRGPADRMSIGAIVLSTAVGLALLGIAERALLDGGPIGGDSGPAGSERAIAPPQQGGAPGEQQPQQPRQPGEGGGATPKSPPNLGVLAGQVRKLTIDERGAAARQSYGAPAGGRPIVDTSRTSADNGWVLGTTALPVPTGSQASPEVAFYAARWTGESWQVALSGGKEFGALLDAVPANVMPAAEVRALRRYSSVTAGQATALVNGTRAGDGLVLPWKVGEVWTMTTSEGASRPLGSLAFSGGDGRVVAAGDGRLYRFCADSTGNALIMLIHPSGVASTYYHLRGVSRVRDGGVVEQGAALGRTGTDRPCGGAASPRPEVGFGLRSGGGIVPLDGAQIGGWTFRERADPLLGFAERGALQVLPGGPMANLGRAPVADDLPSSSPSPRPSAGRGAGSPPAPAAGATQNRSQSGANSQQ